MPSRFVCTVKKAFDKYEVDGEAILSAEGFARMQAKRPGFLALKFEERDGKRFGPDGKQLADKPEPKPAAAAPK